jgi:5-methylcytosine-specific restriction endonuclease McrA
MESIKGNFQFNNSIEKSGYDELLSKPEWKNIRLRIINRDNNMCRSCGCTNDLQVHHKQYHKSRTDGEFKKPWQYQEKYLITLCKSCHQKGHKTYVIPIFNV